MKKFMMIIFALFCVNCVMAQEDWTEEQWKKDMEETSSSVKSTDDSQGVAVVDKETGIIQITVPKKLRISDKVIVENSSAYEIVQMAILVDYKGNGQYTSLASVAAIPIGTTKVAAESDEEFGILRGKPLKIKIKGRRPKSNDETYDFNVNLYEKNHDLYIKVVSNDAFDF